MSTGLINSMELRHEKMNNQFVELANYDNQISIINEKISYSSDIDENEIKQESYESIKPQVTAIDQQINALKDQIADLQKSSDTFEIAEIKRQIDYLASQNNNYRGLIKETNNSYDKKLASNKNNELFELQNTIFGKQKIKDRHELQRTALINERDKIINDYKNSIKANEIQITNLNDKVSRLSTLSNNTQDIVNNYNQEIISLTLEKSRIYKDLNKDIAENIAQSQDAKVAANILVDEKMKLEKERLDIVTKLNKTRDDLVLVVAKFLHKIRGQNADHIADLSPGFIEEATSIVISSLSIVVAIIGPVLAFTAVNNQIEDQRTPKRNKFTYSLRRLFVDLRRKIRKPKVITEVVEQEVEKLLK